MKAKDISDEAFLLAMKQVLAIRPGNIGVTRWDLACALDGHPEWAGQPQAIDGCSVSVPEKVVLAKARRLIRRKLVDGCPCGCRGDFELTEAGAALLRCGKPVALQIASGRAISLPCALDAGHEPRCTAFVLGAPVVIDLDGVKCSIRAPSVN